VEASLDPNPINRLKRVADIQRQIEQNKPNLLKEEQHKIEFQPIDELVVRLGQPPFAVDDKGRVKKYTDKEKRELKGPDPRLPGYTGGLEDLKSEQILTVYLQKPKKEPKPAPMNKDAASEVKRPIVTMVVIVRDAPLSP
jgi:hypothetical protein